MASAVRPFIAALAASLTGCALAYSFDTLTGGTAPAGGDGGDDAAADVAPDAPLGRFCATVDADFCDDFDDDAPIGSHWDTMGAFVNPVLTQDASVTRTDAEAIPILSAPNVIRMRAAGMRAKAALLGLVPPLRDGGAKRGVEINVAIRGEKAVLPPLVEQSRLEGAAILGVLTQTVTSVRGVGIVVRQDTLSLYQTLEGDAGDTAKFESMGNFGGRTVWGRLHFVVGPRADAIARGFPSCEALAPGMVVAAQSGPLPDHCMQLEGSFATPDWLALSGVTLGPGLFGDGEVEMFADNVTVEVF